MPLWINSPTMPMISHVNHGVSEVKAHVPWVLLEFVLLTLLEWPAMYNE